jgi:plastocyanin
MKPKYVTFLLIGMALLSVLLAACVRPGTEPASTTASGAGGSGGAASSSAVVHMNDSNFVQSSVSIKKGESLTLTNDAAVPHQIFNGSWVNGAAVNKQETGAPSVQVQFSGSNESHDIGPFNTAGTFKVYCSIHPNMNLTIVVQ